MVLVDQSIKKQIERTRMITIIGVTSTIVVCYIVWLFCKRNWLHMLRLKEFSTDLFVSFGNQLDNRSVVVDKKISLFKSYTTIKDVVQLKDHRDFRLLKNSLKFKEMIKPIENLPIPSESNFGLIAVFTKCYDDFRTIFRDPLAFLYQPTFYNTGYQTTPTYYNTYGFSYSYSSNNVNHQAQQHMNYMKFRMLLETNENVSSLDSEQLYFCIYFINNYLCSLG